MNRVAIAALCTSLALPLTAAAEDYHETVPARPGGMLTVSLPMGSIVIETHDEDAVDVEASSSGWSGGLRFELTSDGTNAKLEARREAWIFGGFGARARVRVPEHYSLELKTAGGSIEIESVQGSVRAHTSGGSIELDGAVGPVDLSTSGGSIRVEDVRGDTVLRTSGGGITASDVVGAVDAETSGGTIRLSDVDGAVRAHTSGGGISVRFAGSPGGDVATSGGSIEVEIPEGAGAELSARTSGGRIHVEPELAMSGEIDSGRVRGRIGPGGDKLTLETSGGNIRVRER